MGQGQKKNVSNPRLFEIFRKHFNAALDEAGFPSLHYGRQVKVSLVFGVSPSAARKWVMGESLPDIDHLILIADTLNVSTDYLLGRVVKTKTRRASAKNSPTKSIETDGMRLEHDDLKLVSVDDDCMLTPAGSGFGRNDIVVVDTKLSRRLDELKNDAIYLIYYRGDQVIRRLHFSASGLRVICDNPTIAAFSIPNDGVEVYSPGESILPTKNDERCIIMGSVKWSLSAPRG